MSESKDIIDLTITKDDITEVLKDDDKSHPIMIELEKESTLSDEDTSLIPNQLKEKFFDNTIESYKVKCKQYIE